MSANPTKRMTPQQIKSLLAEGSRRLGLSLEDIAIHRLSVYLQELIKWNRKMNLVARASTEEIIEGHFIDSLALAPVLLPLAPTGALLDIGSGAGFPGLVLKAALPDLQVVLIEPRQKRATFLRHVIRTLQLSGIAVHALHLVADDRQLQEKLGRFPAITSRALSDIGAFLSLAEAFIAQDGAVLCMKGPKAAEELTAWQQNEADSPFGLPTRHTYTLPFSQILRSILVFRHQQGTFATCPGPA